MVSCAPPTLQARAGLGQEGLGLVEITGDIQEQAGGRRARLRFQQRQGSLAGGHSSQIIEVDAQPIGQRRPLGLHLCPKVLLERLHDRVGHEFAELGLVPLFRQTDGVRRRDESDGCLGQQGIHRRTAAEQPPGEPSDRIGNGTTLAADLAARTLSETSASIMETTTQAANLARQNSFSGKIRRFSGVAHGIVKVYRPLPTYARSNP